MVYKNAMDTSQLHIKHLFGVSTNAGIRIKTPTVILAPPLLQDNEFVKFFHSKTHDVVTLKTDNVR